jgi:glycerol-1-phosphatase
MADRGLTVLAEHDVLLLDLDGVVYRGDGPVPHARAVLNRARETGVRLGFVTNNASRTPAEVAEHLCRLGIECGAEEVTTSAQVGADLLIERVAAGSTVLAVGGPGVSAALLERGFVPVTVADHVGPGNSLHELASGVAAVLQGYGPDVSWRDLATAAFAVQAGASWVATNTDRTIPLAEGIAPGNGTLVAAVTAATGVTPPAAGKPAAAMMRRAAARLGAASPLVVGDRLDTDIKGANAAGLDSLLVLTGVSTALELMTARPDERPTYMAADLRGLLRALPRLGGEPGDGATDQTVADLVDSCWRGTLDPDEAAARVRRLFADAADR